MRTSIAAFLALSLCTLAIARADDIPSPTFKAWHNQKEATKVTYSVWITGIAAARWKWILVLSKNDAAKITLKQSRLFQGEEHGSDRKNEVEIKPAMDPAKPVANQPTPDDIDRAVEETITVPAGTFKCKKIQFKERESPDDGTVNGTLWFSDQVPGGCVKLDMQHTAFPADHEVDELVTIEKPKN
jgi:hypothetical protein